MRKGLWLSAILLLTLLAACARKEYTPVLSETGVECPLPLPAVFAADIPCRDCPPTHASLTLRQDKLYYLRITRTDIETGSPDVKAEIGRWKYVSKEEAILLETYENVARTLLITPTNDLRVIRVAGGIIPPEVNYDLTMRDDIPRYDDVVRLQGMYSYMADAGLFTECLSGAVFPVAREGENAALERAYMNTPHGQAEAILVSLDGQMSTRLTMEGVGYEEVVVPVHFVEIRPGIECGGERSSGLRLVDNSWRLVEVGGKPVKVGVEQKVPVIHLATKDNRLQGFAGCNRFFGTYLVKGEIFLFNKVAGSRMACVGGMELEDEFFRVLAATEGYRIVGDVLELRDRNGKILAKLVYAGGV